MTFQNVLKSRIINVWMGPGRHSGDDVNQAILFLKLRDGMQVLIMVGFATFYRLK